MLFGEFTCKGEFLNGELVKGKITFRKEIENNLVRETKIIHKGEFENGELIRGKKILSNGVQHQGEFLNGKLIKGKIIFPNGDIYEGNYENNHLIRGTKYFSNKIIHEGEFEKGNLIKGCIIFPNGKIQEKNYNKIIKKNKSEFKCIVCFENKKNMIFPCGHLCVCENCSLNKCPLCRKPGRCFKVFF